MFAFRHLYVTLPLSAAQSLPAMHKREMNKRRPLVCYRKNDYSMLNLKERSCAVPQ